MFDEKKLFVTKEVAILAKNNGFYDPCICGVIGNEIMTGVGFGITNHSNIHDYAIPLCQQLVDWFRDKHLIIDIDVSPFGFYVCFKIGLQKMNSSYSNKWLTLLEIEDSTIKITSYTKNDAIRFDDYYVALNAGFIEGFKLIQNL